MKVHHDTNNVFTQNVTFEMDTEISPRLVVFSGRSDFLAGYLDIIKLK